MTQLGDDLGHDHVDWCDEGSAMGAPKTSQERLGKQHVDIHVKVAVHSVGLGQIKDGQKHSALGRVLKDAN